MADRGSNTSVPSGPNEDVAAELERANQSERRASLVRFGLVGITVIGTVATGVFYDPGTGILVLAGGILLAVIGILWASVRTLSGDAPITLEEAVALGAPTAAEEQKRAVLQALKDLEYERSMGKIVDADYQELLARYRSEAKRLLRAVDENLAPLRKKAEAYVAEQLAQLPQGTPPSPKAPATASASTAAASASASATAASPASPAPVSESTPAVADALPVAAPNSLPCPSCQTSNDVDALFCKKCGTKLSGSSKDHQDAIA